jgi:hypothetical protein
MRVCDAGRADRTEQEAGESSLAAPPDDEQVGTVASLYEQFTG